MRRRHHQQGVPIWLGLGHKIGTNGASSAGAIFNKKLLAKYIGQPLGNDAAWYVGSAAL